MTNTLNAEFIEFVVLIINGYRAANIPFVLLSQTMEKKYRGLG